MGLLAYVRSVLNPTELPVTGPGVLAVGRDCSLWTRDGQQQPAQTITPITPSDTVDLAAATPPYVFRALRADVACTVKMDVLSTLGTPRQTITRNFSAGEVWSASSSSILRIYATGTAVTAGGTLALDGLG